MNTLHGIRVLARAGVDRAVLEGSVRAALEVLWIAGKNRGRRA